MGELVGVAGHEMHVAEAVEAGYEAVSVVRGIEIAGSGVHSDNDAVILGYEGQVLGQPCKLLFSHELIVFPVILAEALAGAEYVVQHDVMHLSYIERIEIRSHFAGELNGILEVAGQIHIVVVVAYGMENRQVLDLVHVGEILLELIVVGIPVVVPGHVTEGKGQHFLRLVAADVVVHIIAELREIDAVIVSATGKMHVTAGQKRIIVLVPVGLDEIEINPFHSYGIRDETLVQETQDSVAQNLVTAWYGNEYIAELLLRSHLIDSAGISLYDLHTVGDDDISQCAALTGDSAVNSCGRPGIQIILDDDLHSAVGLDLLASLETDLVAVGENTLKGGDTEILLAQLDYAALVVPVLGIGENYDVALERSLGKHHPERNDIPFRIDGYGFRHFEFNIDELGLTAFLLAGKESKGEQQRKKAGPKQSRCVSIHIKRTVISFAILCGSTVQIVG